MQPLPFHAHASFKNDKYAVQKSILSYSKRALLTRSLLLTRGMGTRYFLAPKLKTAALSTREDNARDERGN